jgi:hypothetical protein
LALPLVSIAAAADPMPAFREEAVRRHLERRTAAACRDLVVLRRRQHPRLEVRLRRGVAGLRQVHLLAVEPGLLVSARRLNGANFSRATARSVEDESKVSRECSAKRGRSRRPSTSSQS